MATQKQLLDWLDWAPGKSLNPDNAYGLQCKDVVDSLAVALWDGNWVGTIGAEDAKDAYARANPNYFDKLPANAVLQRGDIPVWNGNWGSGHGHIAVLEHPTGGLGEVVQQDGFQQTPAKLVTYNSRQDIIGFLRPKLIKEDIIPMLSKEQIIMIHKLAYQGLEPGPGLVEGWVGRRLDDFVNALWSDPTYAKFVESQRSSEAVSKLNQVRQIVS